MTDEGGPGPGDPEAQGPGALAAEALEGHASAAEALEAEALEAEPPAAAAIFGDRLPLARAYVSLLAREGVVRGLIGPQETARLWTRHVLNCAVIAPLFPVGALADVGSGAGLPGIPVAIVRTDLRVTCIEPMERRTTWLREVVDRLDLTNVDVVRARAEDLAADRRRWDALTARAVKPLRVLVPWVAPLVRDGGMLALMKGSSAETEIAGARSQLKRAGVGDARVERAGVDLLPEPTTVVVGTVRR